MTVESNPSIKLGINGVILLAAIPVSFLADYLFNLTLSGRLTSHEYGDYKVAYAYAVLASMVILLGGDRVAPKMLSATLDQGNNRPVWSFVRFYLKTATLLSVVLIIVTYAGSYLHLFVSGSDQHHPLVLMSFVLPLIAAAALFSRVLQSGKFLILSNLPWRVALPLMKTAMIVTIFWLFGSLALWQVITCGALAVLILVSWQWFKLRQLALISVSPAAAKHPTNHRELLKQSLPMMAAVLVTVALNQIDLFMLEWLAEEHEVGHFGAAATIAHILPVAQTTIAGLFLPLLGIAVHEGSEQSMAVYHQAQKLIFWVLGGLFVVLLALRHTLLGMFGEEYLAANQALTLLCGAYAVWGLAAFSSTWLQYVKRGKNVVWIGLTGIGLDAALNLVLIPRYGIDGAAAATLLTLFSCSVAIWLYQHHTFKVMTRDQNYQQA